VDAAIARLLAERALDDRRTALACARTEAHLKRHGRLRALRTVEALGIDRGLAREAVAEVFGEIDEDALIAHALDRKLRHQPSPTASARQAPPSRTASAGQGRAAESAVARRLYRYLLAQGFDAGRVHAAIRNRVKNALHDD
jgi:SOS response regulatory protein OraA/RecX